jgi:hypothetical protein
LWQKKAASAIFAKGTNWMCVSLTKGTLKAGLLQQQHLHGLRPSHEQIIDRELIPQQLYANCAV